MALSLCPRGVESRADRKPRWQYNYIYNIAKKAAASMIEGNYSFRVWLTSNTFSESQRKKSSANSWSRVAYITPNQEFNVQRSTIECIKYMLHYKVRNYCHVGFCSTVGWEDEYASVFISSVRIPKMQRTNVANLPFRHQ